MKIYNHSSAHMEEINSNTVDLIVTSPPYPMIKKWDDLFGIVDFDTQHDILYQVWLECFRVLKDGGIACINIGDATRTIDKNFQCYPNFARVVYNCMKIRFVPLIHIIWKKITNRPNAFLGSGFLPPNGYVSQDCEYIAIFRKGNIRKFEPHDKIRYKSQFTKEERDVWFSQIWNVPGAKGAKLTTAFPEEIPRRLIRMFSVIGDTVVDPFGGIMTTGKVAKKLKREFIGYEIKATEEVSKNEN